MKYSIILLTSALALTFVSCKNPAKTSTEASVSEAKDVPTAPSTGVRWNFADSSTITFTGSKVTGNQEGEFKKFKVLSVIT